MRRLTADNIRDIAIKSGFKLKEQPNGEMDLNPYVFDFAQSLTAELEKRLAEVERERDEASKSLEYVKERSNKMGDNIKSNNESLCKLIDALSQSNIIIKEFKAALNRIHAECVDVLFDFAARRDSRGLILPMHHQAPEVKEAIAVFEQLRQQLNGG